MKKIIIADSSNTIVQIFSEEFSKKNYTVIPVSNGIECIEKAYSEVPDAIISETYLPCLSGIHVALFLKSSKGIESIPFIILTSSSNEKTNLVSYSAGVDAIFIKQEDSIEKILKFLEDKWSTSSIHTNLIMEESVNFNKENIITKLDSIFESTYYYKSLLRQLFSVTSKIHSLSDTVKKILEIVKVIFEFDIAIILLKSERKILSFILIEETIFEKDTEDFFSICIEDFFQYFDKSELHFGEKVIYEIENRNNYTKINLSKNKISSYLHLPIESGSIIGSIHFGHFKNNYYSDIMEITLQSILEQAAPLIENSVSMQIITNKEKNIRRVFSKFIPSDIIDDLIERNSSISLLSGEKRNVAILFSDIRNFTSFSEFNSPESIVSFLNSYFDVMCTVITNNGGTIDKFIGDAILAIFGAPKSYEDNAYRAVKSAIEMIQSLPKVNYSKVKLLPEGFQIGIGIHEGDVIVGNIGSKDKFDYTVIGDSVNLASRLEGLTKHYKQEVIVSDIVYAKIKKEFEYTRELDKVKVKGKDEPTTIYGVYAKNSIIFDPQNKNYFSKALSMYKIQNWKTALEYFQILYKQMPNDYIINVYIKRCKNFLVNPPENWDGTIELNFK